MFIYGKTAVLDTNMDGFSIQELYRGLSPQQGFEEKEMGTWEIYAIVFSAEGRRCSNGTKKKH